MVFRILKQRAGSMIQLVALGVLSGVVLSAGASAQRAQEVMRDKDIRLFLGGNTIGAHDWGLADSYEYHSRDGRAIWREGEEVLLGFYRVKNGRVCYTYEGPNLGDWFCWDFRKDRRSGEVHQWSPEGNGYRLFIEGVGNVVNASSEVPEA